MEEFTEKQKQAIELLAAVFPASLDAIAAQVGCTRLTLTRWTKKPEFQLAIEEAKKRVNEALLQTQRGVIFNALPTVIAHFVSAVQDPRTTPQSIKAGQILLQIAGLLGSSRAPHQGAQGANSQQPDMKPTMGVIPTETEEVDLDDQGQVVPVT